MVSKKVKKKSKVLGIIKRFTIYTDGSCTGNNIKDKTKRKAGYGIWYGKDDPRNVSKKLLGDPTNNRAELMAIIVALENNVTNKIEIKTDSKYCKNIINSWMYTWKKKGWKKSNGKQPLNIDMVLKLYTLITKRMKYKPIFNWVKAHDTCIGNNAADKLARDGAMLE